MTYGIRTDARVVAARLIVELRSAKSEHRLFVRVQVVHAEI